MFTNQLIEFYLSCGGFHLPSFNHYIKLSILFAYSIQLWVEINSKQPFLGLISYIIGLSKSLLKPYQPLVASFLSPRDPNDYVWLRLLSPCFLTHVYRDMPLGLLYIIVLINKNCVRITTDKIQQEKLGHVFVLFLASCTLN